MEALSEKNKQTFLSIIDDLMLDTTKKASDITLYTLVDPNRTLSMELFSQNIEEYLYLGVAKRITNAFSAGLERALLQFMEVLVQSRNGQILKNPAPYSMIFKLKEGNEYWLDILSLKDYPTLNQRDLDEKRELARLNHSEYRLGLYDSDEIYDEKHLLNGSDLWALVAGYPHAKYDIFSTIHGTANNLSISTLINETHKRLLNEWRSQD